MDVGLDGALFGERKGVAFVAGALAASVRKNGLYWLSERPDYADPWCARTLLKLERRELSVAPPERYARMLSTLGASPDDVWKVVDPSVRRRWAKDLLRRASDALDAVDPTYHRDHFAPTSRLLSALRPWRARRSIADSDDPEARSCAPDAEGLVRPPTYDRFGTRTGRMTVADGPRILTVRKSTRELFSPVDDEHVLASFDFASLEARIALALAGRPAARDEDPYELVRRRAGASSREEAKRSTFSALYSDPTSERGADPTTASTRRLFRLGETFARLRAEERPRNLYGRLLDSPPETLYNNYVQSTGADAVLHGFLDFLGRPEARSIVPHFLLHDALFASVPRDVLEPLSHVAAEGVRAPSLDCSFPLAVAVVGESG